MTEPMKMRIGYTDTDVNGTASPKQLMRCMIEASITQSMEAEKNLSQDITWMLYRWDVEFKEFPKPGSLVFVETNAVGFQKYYAHRDFVVICDEREIARAKTVWVAASKQTGKLVKVPKEYIDAYDIKNSAFMLPTYGEETLDHDAEHIEFRIRQSDIDTNQHVNNLVYVDWIMECITREYQSMHALANMTVIYRKELRYPGTAKVTCHEGEDAFFHEIMDGETGTRSAYATTVWRAK